VLSSTGASPAYPATVSAEAVSGAFSGARSMGEVKHTTPY
jgi:hypothetical protein